jgi:DNA-binding response OmpR family regulator
MRILIVEDEHKLAKSLAAGLEKSGFAADILENGNDAITRISLYRNEYDVIILDLMLPGASGQDVCREVRELGVTTPILILTARDEIETKVDVLNMGADDYLPKPFSFDELLARINALMRRPNEAKPIVLMVQDITLDTASHTVQKGGKEMPLTLKEYAVLEYLMRHPGRALTREDILDHVWDFQFSSFSNVVDVHVKNLRKKLGDESGRVIETVRGVGYRMVE